MLSSTKKGLFGTQSSSMATVGIAAPRVMLGIGFAVAGIAVVSFSRNSAAGGSEASLAGNLLLVGAVICEASYVVIGKMLTGNVSPKRISALINLWGLALVTPFGLWQALHFDFNSVPVNAWALLLFYSMAASVVTVWLWMTGLRVVPAAQAGVYSVLLPIFTALTGVWVLGETLGPVQLLAFFRCCCR